MQFKNYASGNLNFINVSIRKYYKSKGYYAFFSENELWKILLNVLFKDVFKRFKRIAWQKDINTDLSINQFLLCSKLRK